MNILNIHASTVDLAVLSVTTTKCCTYGNPSSLKPFSQTYSLKGENGGVVGPLPKIFVMLGPINLRFGVNVTWTSNFHLILITY